MTQDLLPEGEYTFAVERQDFREAASGMHIRLVLKLRVATQPQCGELLINRTLLSSYALLDKGRPYVNRLLFALGLPEWVGEAAPNMDGCIGQQFEASLKHQVVPLSDGGSRTFTALYDERPIGAQPRSLK